MYRFNTALLQWTKSQGNTFRERNCVSSGKYIMFKWKVEKQKNSKKPTVKTVVNTIMNIIISFLLPSTNSDRSQTGKILNIMEKNREILKYQFLV